jgi:leader peptidase (prepilin peptidase)/N-methyltransferase
MRDLKKDVAMTLFELLASHPPIFIGVVFLFSLLVGSFLNVVIHRLPIMLEADWRSQAEAILSQPNAAPGTPVVPPITAHDTAPAAKKPKYNLMVPRSACPKCKAPITALQNIPVISWLWLRGKCAACGTPISARYPIIELFTAVASAVVAWKLGYQWYTLAALGLTWTLIAASIIDIDHQLLPDNMTLPLIWAGLLLSLAANPEVGSLPVEPRTAIIGGVAGYLSLWTVNHVFLFVTRRDVGMGYGDFKLFAVFGAWLGWQKLPLVILLSATTGAVVGICLILFRGHDRNVPIPFGPYLAAAGWIALLWGDAIVDTYMRLSGIGQI